MTFKQFFQQFPNEEACKQHFKAYRDKSGVTCKKCKGKEHYWLSTISYYKCKSCGFRTSLKSGTVMENSKLPYQHWYMAFMLVSSTKKSFSALEIQRQIEHKFYEPIWAMMHKIRRVMGQRDAEYKLENTIEMDEGFFITTPDDIRKDSKGKRLPRLKKRMKPGKGSPRTATVLVMTESIPNFNHNNIHKSKRAVRFIKMIRVEDNRAETILPEVRKNIACEGAEIITDAANHYSKLHTIVKGHRCVKMTHIDAHTALPWVHKTISNAKRNFLGIHHSIGRGYIQNYLDEFCFKFNRRYNEMDLFDRTLNVATNYQWYN